MTDYYLVTFAASAKKELKDLPSDVIGLLLQRIRGLSYTPRPVGCKKLHGYKDRWRIRVGDYRVVYAIDDDRKAVDVTRIAHRKEGVRMMTPYRSVRDRICELAPGFAAKRYSQVARTVQRPVLLLLLSLCVASAGPKALFYMTQAPTSVQSFLAHADKVDILVPTWYNVDAAGMVWGGPDELVMETARKHRVPVMPIVVNPGFNQVNFHKLMTTARAAEIMIDTLIGECKKHGYAGIQFDFENIAWTDRDALTGMVREAAAAFHKEGLQLSIATVPNAPGYPGHGGFAKWIYENWRGGYDLKALAEQVDLICLMTYDEHTRYTPPGPVSGYPWALENLEYALKTVPKEKLSLGIPLYGYRWFAGDPGKDAKPSISAASIGGSDIHLLIETFHPHVEWDPGDKTAWFYFYRDAMREWVFYTDARTFKERLNLVSDRGIQGFCSWVLGQEDPAIWDALPTHGG